MTADLSPADTAKKAAAMAALELVEDGMKLGLGTGSTAAFMVDGLGAMVRDGLKVVGVPTSERTKKQAEGLGIPLSTLGELGTLDLTIDGADEFDGALNLIKGGGGALLQEKIVAAASTRMLVVSDPSKKVATLGAFPLPVEVVRFGWQSTAEAIKTLLATADVGNRVMSLRGGDAPYVTDEGHYIIDLALTRIGDAAGLNAALNVIPGVVETGLFCGLASATIVGHPDGSIERIG